MTTMTTTMMMTYNQWGLEK